MENILYSVSLLIYIWGLVEHGHAEERFSKESVAIPAGCRKDVKKIVGRVECDLQKQSSKYLEREKKNANIFIFQIRFSQ